MTPFASARGQAAWAVLTGAQSPAGSWHELIRLVSAALSEAGAGPVPRYAMASSAAGGPVAEDPSGPNLQAIDSSVRLTDSTRRPSPFPHTNEEPSKRSPSEAGDRPDGVEAEHLEVWRLVTAAQGGDGDAFGQLYDRYVDAVFRFIYYRVNDRALAEDFTSETFLRALRRISTISYQGRDIGAWFMTIARNIVFDHSKSARFRLEVTTGDQLEGQESEPSPEASVLAKLSNETLLRAVNELNDEQKECIVLRFLNGLSVAETAEVMGKNDGAIKALQHRAVKRLAALVSDELR
jgi:RNA polymerase sigma-70 factor, ECF subfamily